MLRKITLYSDIYTKKKLYEFVAHSKKEVKDIIQLYILNNPSVYIGYISQELVTTKKTSMLTLFEAITDEDKLIGSMIQLTGTTITKKLK